MGRYIKERGDCNYGGAGIFLLCYGCVTKGQNPLTNQKVGGKVTSQDEEGLGAPSTDTGTASHGMCARNAENLRILKKIFALIRGAMRPLRRSKSDQKPLVLTRIENF